MSATSSNRMQKLTPDGGIVKVVLDSPDSAADLLDDLSLASASASPSKIGQSIKWAKGVNAKLHYSVCTAPFRPLVEQKSSKQLSASKCGHSHAHKHNKHHKHSKNCKHDHQDNTNAAATKSVEENAINVPATTGPVFASPSGVQFQFDPSARHILADTRRDDGQDQLFELRIGRNFSFAALETAVKSMKVGETAKFLIAPEYSTGFIQLESTLRRHRATLHAQRQGLAPPPTCCMGLASDSDAHADLYASADVPLELQVTLYDVQMPDEYVPEAWEMSAIDKANKVPELKAHATSEFQQGHVKQAREAYARALEYLESVQLELARQKREEHAYVPGTQVPPGVKRIEAVSPEWVDKTVLALRLNIALCSLKMNEYDKCVAQCSAVLEANPECVKARFRRALAHLRRGRDLELAQRDLLACIAPGVKGGLAKEDAAWASAWKELEAKRKLANEKEKGMWRGMFAT